MQPESKKTSSMLRSTFIICNAASTGERTAQRFASPAHVVRGGDWPCYEASLTTPFIEKYATACETQSGSKIVIACEIVASFAEPSSKKP